MPPPLRGYFRVPVGASVLCTVQGCVDTNAFQGRGRGRVAVASDHCADDNFLTESSRPSGHLQRDGKLDGHKQNDVKHDDSVCGWANTAMWLEIAACLIGVAILYSHRELEQIQSLRIVRHVDGVSIVVTGSLVLAVFGLIWARIRKCPLFIPICLFVCYLSLLILPAITPGRGM